MVREFKLPDVGEGLTEAEIVSWLVEPGDAVSEDQPVAEVETDKAVVEVPSPVNGTVREILVDAGDVVEVGTVIITFDVEGEAAEETGEAAGAGPSEGAEASAAAEQEVEAADETAEAPQAPSEASADSPGAAPAEETDESDRAPGGRVFAAPSARRLARELGVDIASVDGSGPGGRVAESDVRAAVEGGAAEEEPAEEPVADEEAVVSATERVDEPTGGETAVGAEPPEAAERDRTLAAPATRRLAEEEGVDIDTVPTDEERDGQPFVTPEQVTEYAAAQRSAREAEVAGEAAPAAEPEAREERVPYRGIRRTIGKQMERSAFTAPHVTHHDEMDVTRLAEVRSRLKAEAEERGISLSYMPLVAKAVVAALKQHPILNSTLDEEAGEIVTKHYYNIGVATATDAGLMVPVVRDVDGKDTLTVASEMNELVSKARDRAISREEMQGGTFTITNFGAIGGEYATPIINYPETAILGLGAIKEKPRVVDGEVVPRKVLTVSLSIDHRVIDGADAARFTNTLKRYLEEPELLLLE